MQGGRLGDGDLPFEAVLPPWFIQDSVCLSLSLSLSLSLCLYLPGSISLCVSISVSVSLIPIRAEVQ